MSPVISTPTPDPAFTRSPVPTFCNCGTGGGADVSYSVSQFSMSLVLAPSVATAEATAEATAAPKVLQLRHRMRSNLTRPLRSLTVRESPKRMHILNEHMSAGWYGKSPSRRGGHGAAVRVLEAHNIALYRIAIDRDATHSILQLYMRTHRIG